MIKEEVELIPERLQRVSRPADLTVATQRITYNTRFYRCVLLSPLHVPSTSSPSSPLPRGSPASALYSAIPTRANAANASHATAATTS